MNNKVNIAFVSLGPVLALSVLMAMSGCVYMTDVTDELDNPAIKGNPFCVRGTEFIVQYPVGCKNVIRREQG
jgi:hypothetical protein